MKTLVSVIVPVYNVKDYLNRCINSLVNQTYEQLQIILVDDGSTDGSGNICDRWASRDSRIEIVHQKNSGPSAARNFGTSIVRGAYLMYVDSDDWIEPEMIESMLEYALETGADIITSGCKKEYSSRTGLVDESPETLQPGLYEGESLHNLLDTPFSYDEYGSMEFRFKIFACTKLYRSSIVRKVYRRVANDMIHGEDAALMFSCLMEAESVYVTGRDWYHYMLRNDSLSYSAHSAADYDSLDRFFASFAARYVEKYPHLLRHLMVFATYNRLHGAPESVIHVRDGVIFPFENVSPGETVAFYGASNVGIAIRRCMEEKGLCKVLAHGDRKSLSGMVSPEDIVRRQDEFEHILISIVNAQTACAAEKSLISLGVDPEKLCRIRLLPEEKAFNKKERG